MADFGGIFGHAFGGDFAGSFAKGMQIGMMQRQMEMQEKKMQQDYELNHLLREEQTLKVRAQRNALEEANKYRQQWEALKEPGQATIQTSPEGYDFSAGESVPAQTQTIQTPSKMQQMFPGQVGQILEMGGPDMMKTIAPKLIEDSMGGKPVSDIGKLQYDRQQAISRGYPENHPYIQAIDRKIGQAGEMTDYQRESLDLRRDLGQQNLELRREMRAQAGMNAGKLDQIGAATLIRTLPKLKSSAIDAATNINRIDMMTGLLEQGAGGKIGQIKGKLAPYLESLGMDVSSISDKQLYEVLAQSLAGSMRMQIVGPGAVSDYEQKLLQKVSGGGNTAIPAAKQLLNFYKQNALLKVNDYNDSIDQVSGVSPGTSKLYKKINIEKPNDPLGIR